MTTLPRTAGPASTPTTSAGHCGAQALQHTPDAKIAASDVLKLPALKANTSALSILEVLAAAGVLDDDRLSPIERYFAD